MAANLNALQMGGGANNARRPTQHPQLASLVYSQIVQQQFQSGWQTSVQPSTRVGNAMNIITNTFLAAPQTDSNQSVSMNLAFEREAFTNSPDKATYDQAIQSRIHDLFKKRQANEQTLHNSLNAQVAAQAQAQTQAQMMMSQNMRMGAVGQPLPQGLQNPQQQVQPSPINQPGQLNMGVGHPNNLPMNPGATQMMQMGGQMRPQMPVANPMAGLTPQDQVKVNNHALARINQMSDQQRGQLRMMLQNRLGRDGLARLQQENLDPMVYYMQSQIIQGMRSQQAGVNVAGMAMQAHQNRVMNQQGQQLTNGPNGPFFSNVDILNQQKAGMMAQEAGQMVVPASTVAGRNPTPQPLGPSPNPNQGAGQPAMPHQLQHQQFNQPQLIPQQIKMDQRAAESQVQIRAHSQAKQLQGQPGGLNGPGAVSQSPAMGTLNTPVRRPMVGVQPDGHPPMGPGNMPFGQPMMDPRFNQMGQRPAVGPNADANRRQMLNSLMQQMPPETQQQILGLPADKIPEMIMKWDASRRGMQMSGQPQSQHGQLGPGGPPVAQPTGQFSPGSNNLGQQPGMGMPMSQQNQMLIQQQQQLKLRNPNGLPHAPDRNALMDSMNVPAKILSSIASTANSLPPDLKRWGQLKHWFASQNTDQARMQQLLSIQNAQFQSFLKNQAQAQAQAQLVANHQRPPQPNMQPQGVHANGQAMPQLGQPASNMGATNPMPAISPQEMQSAKSSGKFKGWPDEKIHQMLVKMKMVRKNGSGHPGGPQAQQPQPKPTPTAAQATPPHGLQPSATAVPQPTSASAAPTPQAGNRPIPQQRQQNAVPEPNPVNPPPAQNRNAKQPQNNRAVPNVAAAPTSKLGTKRRSSDDVAEIPNPSNAPSQRPTSQQAQPSSSAPSHGQVPYFTPEQIAAMSPEQRQRYETMIKSRQNVEAMARLKAIGQDQHQQAVKEQLADIPMSPEQYRDTAQKIQALCVEMTKISRILGRWYTLTRDDVRATLFFKMRLRLMKQYVDGDKLTTLRDKFSISAADLDKMRNVLESMAGDVANHFPQRMMKNLSQQNAPDTPLPAAAPTPQPAPLSAANLEKQTQALNKAHQKSNSRAGQPPAAPTTAQPPFPFGAQSPDGQPTYAGKPAVTQDNLQLPPRKKARTGTVPNAAGPSASASPKAQKPASPEVSKRPATAEAKQTMAKPQFVCPEPGCEFQSIGFTTEKAQQKHMEEEHIKPAEDPFKFVSESLADALGLDANGKPKKPAAVGSNAQSPGDIPKQQSGASPGPGRLDLANPRGTPMGRQSSTAGSKPNELIKSIASKTGTPKVEGNPAPTGNGNAEPQMMFSETWGTTIDPQELLFRIPGLDYSGGGAISNSALYRSMTPNLTPESAKDSASSEPNSDVSEGVALNLTLDLGLNRWDPFSGGQTLDPDTNFDLDPNDITYPTFTSWDEVNPDFDKPFKLDTSLWTWEPPQ